MIDDYSIHLCFHPNFLVSFGQRNSLQMVFPMVSCFWVWLVLQVYLAALVVIGEPHGFLYFRVEEFCGGNVLLCDSDDKNHAFLKVLISDMVNKDFGLGKVDGCHFL
jgi:hypothetical protein